MDPWVVNWSVGRGAHRHRVGGSGCCSCDRRDCLGPATSSWPPL